jgi:hypothetical protein
MLACGQATSVHELAIYLCIVLADLRAAMGNPEPDTVVTFHVVVRPAKVGKGSGMGRAMPYDLLVCSCKSAAVHRLFQRADAVGQGNSDVVL